MKNDIFESFFEKLSADKDFPNESVEKLKELRRSGDLTSRAKILSALKTGGDNGED